jgi:ornithine decarboxylase
MKNYEIDSWLERIALAGEFEAPIILTDVEIIEDKCRTYKSNFPDISLCYAVKAFPHEVVLSSVEPFVDGFDVASVAEIRTLLKLGVDQSRMNYSNPVKSEASIKEAARLGVTKFAFQSMGELDKITKHAAGAEVYARVKMGDSKGAQSFSSKFGCPVDQVVDLLKYAKKVGLNPVGITFHIGSQATELEAWGHAIRSAQEIITNAREAGVQANLINIGGGLPVQYEQGNPSVTELANTINEAIENGPSDIKYVAEPGRFLVADSSVILATVIGREDRADKPWLFIDVGAFQAFIEVFEFDSFFYPVYSTRHLRSGHADISQMRYTLTGPSCDSCDTLSHDIMLPADVKEGDQIMIAMTGAYTVVYGSNFNGFKVPTQHFVAQREEL